MTLTEQIKLNPYFKVSNLCDESDCIHAIQELRELIDIHPNSKMLRDLQFRVEYKRMKFSKS